MNFKKNFKKKKASASASDQETCMQELELFEQFRNTVPKELQQALLSGKPVKDILKQFESHAAIRMIQIALTDPDASKALAAAKDILDRSQGKAVETKKLEHSMADMSEKELDALLKSEEADLKAMEGDDDDGKKEIQ